MADRNAGPSSTEGGQNDIIYPSAVPFCLLHLACLGAFWTGITGTALAICAAFYALGMFGITAGYHRYFSHRSYAAGRICQFVLAFLAQSTAQKSVLWWAAKHRHHHLHSDTAQDVHSPRMAGFWYSHVGWVFAARHASADLARIEDLTRFPELRWLHRFELAPALVLAGVAFLIGGWSGLVVGFVWSRVLLYHATFCINSLAHVHGRKRYVTGDDSRNNWLLALVTFGEGWHNNHHAYQSSVRQGFRWWEVDCTFYALKALSWVGLVRHLKSPPEAVVRNERPLGLKVIEKAATQLAASFHVDRIAGAVRGALVNSPSWPELHDALTAAQRPAVELLVHLHVPALPTRQDIRHRAAAMFVRTRSLEDIVDRAHHLVLEAVCARLASPSAAAAA